MFYSRGYYKTVTKGKRRWDGMFSPLQVGKQWFYGEIRKIAQVETRQGDETNALREGLELKKTKRKVAEIFEAHYIDSWVLANGWTGGHVQPDNKQLLCITPLRFHRRQLHRLQPEKSGIRKPHGGTLSHGFKRGSLIKHPTWAWLTWEDASNMPWQAEKGYAKTLSLPIAGF
jgi:hypothetical protein